MTPQTEPSGFSRFIAEMRRRHVVRFALGYAAAAFVVLQLAEIVFPAFGLGEAGLRILVVVVTLGFPPATVLAWVFDITDEGIKRTEGRGPDGYGPRLALLGVTIAIVGGLGLWLASRGVFSTAATDAGVFDAGQPPLELAVYDPSAPITSIAVLPLEDFSENGGQAYFTSGLHEELIAKLSQVDGLRVVSRTSVSQYAGTAKTATQIGRELGVDALIEGSVKRDGDQVRITLQIIHAPSDSHIQTLQFDRTVTNVLALQTEIAHAVVHEIDGIHEESEFTQVAMDVEPDAQEAYLKGKYEYSRGTPEGYQMALDYFKEAVDDDPEFAAAIAGMAGARFLVHSTNGEISEDEIGLARAEAAHALQLDSGSMEAMEVFAFIERSIPLIPAPVGAPATLESTDRILVADAVIESVSVLGTDWASAMTSLGQRLEEQGRKRTMDGQRGGEVQQALAARQLIGAGRFGDATTLLREIVTSTPEAGPAWELLVRAEISEGDADEASAVVREWSESGASAAPTAAAVAVLDQAVRENGVRGYWGWSLARLEAKLASGGSVSHTDLAAALAGTDDNEAAFTHLAAAVAAGERGVLTLRTDPVWDRLRRDPRFTELAGQARAIRFAPGAAGGRGRGDPNGRRN